MKDLFYMGGPTFMGILTIVLIVLVAWTIYHFLPVILKKEIDISKSSSRLKHIKTIGTFGLITGFLGQMIGLSAAFHAVEQAEEISMNLLAGGIKVTTICNIYGMLIFLISLILWFVTDFVVSNKSK